MDVIKGRGLTTREAYGEINRAGRKTAIGPASRDFIWRVYQVYQERLAQIEKWDFLDLAIQGVAELERDEMFVPYDAVIVDEAQDLRPIELQAIAALAGGAKARNLLLLADPGQSIYYKGISWKEGGIHIAPVRSHMMSRNYRNTQEILAAAWSMAVQGTSDDLDEELVPPDVTDQHGPKPVIIHCADANQQSRFIIDMITDLCRTNQFRPGDIAVLARNKDTVNDLHFRLQNAHIPSCHFRSNAFDIFENEVKVITMNSAKGLEFPVVMIADLVEGVLPRALHAENEDEESADLRSERRLAYVGMTRAARRLYLLTYAPPSRFLEELDPQTVRSRTYPSGD